MKAIAALSLCLALAAQAAVSDLLFPLAELGPTPGKAGNLTYNGTHFVAVLEQINGCVITFLHTNADVSSNLVLRISAQAPSVMANGTNLLLTWTDKTGNEPVLYCSLVGDGGALDPLTLASNAVSDSVALRSWGDRYLAIWQSTDATSAVQGRWIGASGEPAGDAFSVSPSAASQAFPSVNVEGTNALVAWMEQNTDTNDWRVVGRFVNEAGPTGGIISISETNSLRPYRTACAFGTNFLVAWSHDVGPWPFFLYDPDFRLTNAWYPVVDGRIITAQGPGTPEFPLIRGNLTNIDVTVAFGGDRFLVACANHNPASTYGVRQTFFRAIRENGSLTDAPFHGIRMGSPALAYGGGRWCSATTDDAAETRFTFAGHQTMPDLSLVNLRRGSNGTIRVESSRTLGDWEPVQLSTNLIDWNYRYGSVIGNVPRIAGEGRLFVRLYEPKWTCVENLRAIEWGKLQWAFDSRKGMYEQVTDTDLFGVGKYIRQKPSCPLNGSYTLNSIDSHPMCSISGHTL